MTRERISAKFAIWCTRYYKRSGKLPEPMFTEDTIEQAALGWLSSFGYNIKHGSEIAPGELTNERADYGQIVLEQRLRDALTRLNSRLSAEPVNDAFRKLTRLEGATPETRNVPSNAGGWSAR